MLVRYIPFTYIEGMSTGGQIQRRERNNRKEGAAAIENEKGDLFTVMYVLIALQLDYCKALYVELALKVVQNLLLI